MLPSLILVGSVAAQYGPGTSGVIQSENAMPPGSFQQSVSPTMAEKTASILIDVLAGMHERRATQRAGEVPDWSNLSTPLVRVNSAGEVHVYVVLSEFRPEYVAQLEALGLRVELVSEQFRTVQGWLHADAMATVAALDFVREIKPPGYALPNQSGAVDTAGNSVLRANVDERSSV